MKISRRVAMLPLAAEATWWLFAAWLLLDILPGKLYRRILPPAREPGQLAGADERSQQKTDPSRIDAVSRMLRLLAPRLPFRAECFQQGLAADRMLHARGIEHVLHYGVQRSVGTLKGHVWVTAAGRAVVGVGAAAGYHEILQFVRTKSPEEERASSQNRSGSIPGVLWP